MAGKRVVKGAAAGRTARRPAGRIRLEAAQEQGQQALPLEEQDTHGGARKGAGRKRKALRPQVSRRGREALSGREPVHVTVRTEPRVPNLRDEPIVGLVLDALSASRDRAGIRLTHFSVQENHLHLIVEPGSTAALSLAMQGLGIRMARTINRILGTRGRIFADRYHARVLRSPAEVRNAVAYVLDNARIHRERQGEHLPVNWRDPCAAGPRCDELATDDPAPLRRIDLAVVPPRTWLLREGWKRRAAARQSAR